MAKQTNTTFHEGLTLGAVSAYDSTNERLGVGRTDPAAKLNIYNNDTGVSTLTGIVVEQAGTGDALLQLQLTGTRRWVVGVDNSDSDKFKISPVTDLANGIFTILTTGNVGIGTASPTSLLTVAGSIALPVVSKTANYTLTASDYAVLCDATSGSITMALPAASGCSGRVYVIKKIDASGNTVVIDGNSSETIDGAATSTLTTQYQSLTIISNGTNWHVI